MLTTHAAAHPVVRVKFSSAGRMPWLDTFMTGLVTADSFARLHELPVPGTSALLEFSHSCLREAVA